MDKNEKEKQLLLKWAAGNAGNYQFQTIDQSKDSYFIQRDKGADQNQYIREYGFDTLPELLGELDTLWKEDEVMASVKRVVGIASLKNKPSREVQETTIIEDKDDGKKEMSDRLPEFIYNF